jgi:hypothetical protein
MGSLDNYYLVWKKGICTLIKGNVYFLRFKLYVILAFLCSLYLNAQQKTMDL